MRIPFVVGNWKMNLDRQGCESLAKDIAAKLPKLQGVRAGVCPPFPYLMTVHAQIKNSPVVLGSQNVYCESKGAFTGEVSPAMALDCGCTWTLVGHSERRLVIGEDNKLINKKVNAALAAGLNVILCIGETLEQRQQNQTEKVVESQLAGSLEGITPDPEKLVLAYEPVWAIGTGVVATPDQAEEVHQFIRGWLTRQYSAAVAEKLCIQYGGSVNAGNAKQLISQPNVDGLLVGGASLKADEFVTIIIACQN